MMEDLGQLVASLYVTSRIPGYRLFNIMDSLFSIQDTKVGNKLLLLQDSFIGCKESNATLKFALKLKP